MGAVFKRRGGDSLGMGRGFKSTTNRLDFSSNFASRVPRFSPRFLPRSRRDFRHDCDTIGLRSIVNHDARASLITCRSMGDKFAPIPPQNLLDRGSIAPRSRHDHAAIVEFFHKVPPPSDRALTGWTIAIGLFPCAAIVRGIYYWSSDGDPAV